MHKIKTKIQILNEDLSAFGPGKAQLLQAIDQYGSISAAAKNIKMSYKRAWDLVNAMNAGFEAELVTTKIGGPHGGGAGMTDFGRQVLSLYQTAAANSDVFINKQFTELVSLLKQVH